MKPALPPPGYAAAALAAAVLSLLGMASSPAAPAWWSDPATSIAGDTPINDWAAANLGQLKHVATQAKAHLDFTLASIGGAGPEIDAMCQFTQQDNYAPAAVGQLKNVAKVFYDRLAQAQWNWQTGYPGTATAPYPWTGTVHAENAAPINIGQLKNAFSFDLSSWASFDQDADSMADGWEVYYGLNPGNSADGGLDWDNDGLTNQEEYNANANPLTADTDGDFSPDAEEVEEGTDPRRDTSAPVTLCAVYDSVHWLMDYLPPANPQPWETSHPIWYEYFQRWDGQPAAIRPGGRGGPLYDPPGSLSGQASLIDTAATLTAWNVRWDHTTVLRSEAEFRSDGEGSASTHAARLWLRGPKSSSPVTRSFVKLVRREVPPTPPLSGTTYEYSTVTFTLPANQNHSAPQSFTAALSSAEPARSYVEETVVSLLPVEVDIRAAATSGSGSLGNTGQDEDFAVVSNGADNDLASELVISLPAGAVIGNITANLKMNESDGMLKFEQNNVSITPGIPKVIKIWGTTASSGENKSKIGIEFGPTGGSNTSIIEDLTIIDGVEIAFEGNYYINVDTREFGRRPWDGRVDPKPNTKFNMTGYTDVMDAYFAEVYPGRFPTQAEKDAFQKATDQSDQLGYSSAVSFKMGDNNAIPAYKPWADLLKVTVSKVTSVNPKVDLKRDKIIGAEISVRSGRLDGLPDGSEKLLDPKLELGNFVLLENTSSTTSIAAQATKSASVSPADIQNGLLAYRGKGYDEMLDFHKNFSPGSLAAFSGARFKWENDTFEVTRETKFTHSIAAKALAAKKQTLGKVAVSWIFEDWNELKFQGKLSEAKVSTK